MRLSVRRIFAFLIDYTVIMMYAMLLFTISSSYQRYTGQQLAPLHPFSSQLLAFFTLTLPVYLYFVLMESGKKRATIGKQMTGLEVVWQKKKGVYIRNLVKLLPWEVAHTGVHWLIYINSQGGVIPIWVWTLLVLPQMTLVIYLVSAFITGGTGSFHDTAGGTSIRGKQFS